MIEHNRKLWIDALRAIAMIFVVFGHQAQWCDAFFLYTTPIKIPLFFAITGYIFNPRDGNQKTFFKNWFTKLVFPYFCLATIPVLFYALFYGVNYIWASWYKMISGESYWFMPCLIIAEVIHFYVRKFSHKQFYVALISLIIAFFGFVYESLFYWRLCKI